MKNCCFAFLLIRGVKRVVRARYPPKCRRTESMGYYAVNLKMMSAPRFAHPSIADIPEDKLIQRLLGDPIWPKQFFELYGMPKGMGGKQCVLLDTAPGNFKGDIDVLFAAPDNPKQAVAYQVKRIKFGISALRPGGKPNKLRELAKAADQANVLARIGFWQVYLYIVVVVDAREQNTGKITYQGLSSELKSLVSSVISPSGLDDRVGLADLDFTQPMDHAPFEVGTHGMHLHRLSRPASQSQELTEWVAGTFRNS